MATPVPSILGRVPVSLSSQSRLVPSVQSPAVWTWTTLSPHRRGPVPHCSVRCPRSTVQESTVHGLLFRARDLAFVYFKARGTRAPYFSKRPGLHTRQCGRVTIRDRKERVLQYYLFHLCSPARPCLANAQIVHGVLCGCWVSYSCFPAKGRQFLALEQYCSSSIVAASIGTLGVHGLAW